MTVWDQIDELRRKHAQQLEATANELEALKAIAGSLSTDEYGNWTCRYIAAGNGRTQDTLKTRSGSDLVAKLRAIREAEAKKAAEAKQVSLT